jgi:hypothetical protein
MKVVVRSSSLLFFLVNVFLGLPVHRRLLRNVGMGLDRRRPVRQKPLPTERENSSAATGEQIGESV